MEKSESSSGGYTGWIFGFLSLAALSAGGYFGYQQFKTLDEKLQKMEKEKLEILKSIEKRKDSNEQKSTAENLKKSENETQNNNRKSEKAMIEKMMENIEMLKETQKNIQENYENEKKLREETQAELKNTAYENLRLIEDVNKNRKKKVYNITDSFDDSNSFLTRTEILTLLTYIRNRALQRIKEIKETYKAKRRLNLTDEDKYRLYVHRMNKGISEIQTDASNKILIEHKIEQTYFNDSIANFQDDEEIMTLLNNLATDAVIEEAPETQTSEVVEEIQSFYQNINDGVLNTSHGGANIDYDVFQARAEDKIYERYGIELEHIAAYFLQPGNQNLNETLIGTLKSTSNKILNMNRSYLN